MIELTNCLQHSRYVPVEKNSDTRNSWKSLPDKGIISTFVGRENVHPTGCRVIVIPSQDIFGNYDLTVKGYIIPPVQIYGRQASEQFVAREKWKGSSGLGIVPIKDANAELGRYQRLVKYNPNILHDMNSPIWKVLAVFKDKEQVVLDRWGYDYWDKSKKIEKGVVVCRVPFLNWRLADCYFEEIHNDTDKKFDRLRKYWNLPTDNHVYRKAISRLGEAMGYFWNAHIAHTNIYWRLPNKDTGIIYARPNSHNINIDGSVGDYVENGSWPIKKAPDQEIANETVGAFSSYIMMIATRTGNGLTEEKISGLVDRFANSLPVGVSRRIIETCAISQTMRDYENRKRLLERGISVHSGMEYFNTQQFMRNVGTVIKSIERLGRRLAI